MKLPSLLIAAAAASLLSGCFFGDDEETPPAETSNEVPASATVSATAYTQYTGSLLNSETATPLDVNKVTPPTSDNTEPQPL